MQLEELKTTVEAANSSNNIYLRLESKLDALVQYTLEAGESQDLTQLKQDVEGLSKAVNVPELTDEEAAAVDADFDERVQSAVAGVILHLQADVEELKGAVEELSRDPALSNAPINLSPAPPQLPESGEFLCVIEDCEHAAAGHGYKTWAGFLAHAHDKHASSPQVGQDGAIVFVQDVPPAEAK